MNHEQGILENIRQQPENLARVADYHLGDGWTALAATASILREARQIIFTGMGSSLFASIPAAKALNRHGFPALTLNAAELLHGDYPAFRNAVLVLVSRSGESVEVTRLLPLLKAQGTTVIGLTNVPDSTLAREAHHMLLMNSQADAMVSIQTYTATILALLLLTVTVIGEAGTDYRRRLDTSIGAMETAVREWVAASELWIDFLQSASVVYLLGRSASLASTMQGALMFNEVAKTPSVSMEIGLFRHGPVEVVNERFHALVFTPKDTLQRLNLAAVHDLVNLGGHVRHIGPDPGELDPSLCWCTPLGISPEFAPLVEIMPVQLAAFQLARRRGITPGQLLITPLVTRDEIGFAARKGQ
jgi:glucosamine--fructose-6-phosphate aminotransferase (isomerizing)